MAEVVYKVVEHDGGWAYKVGDVFSETFRSQDEAVSAAEVAAIEQRAGGETEAIEYQDEAGVWKVEAAEGGDRPSTDVEK